MSDDEFTRVRTILRSSSVPPASVDVQRAITNGYRQLRIRRIVRSASAMVLAAAVITGTFEAIIHWPAGSQPQVPAVSAPANRNPSTVARPAEACTVELLALPGADAMHVDPTGTYISLDQLVQVNGAYHTVLWSGGHQVTVPLPAGASNAQTNGINAHGALVGMATTDTHKQFAFVYRDGKVTRLPALSGYSRSTAWGINAAGDIVGASFNDNGGDVPVLWPADAPNTVHRLGSNGEALAIGDDGTIVGTAGDGDAPWVWKRNGAGHALPTLPNAAHGKAFTIRGDWAAGWASDTNPVPMTRWNLRTGAVQTFTSVDGPATGVNARGDLVNGYSNDGGTAIRDGQPLPLAVGRNIESRPAAVWISDDGRTLIGSLVGPGPSRAALWHC